MQKNIYLLLLFLMPFALFAQSKWSVIFGTEEFTGLVKKNLPEDLPEKIVQNKEGEIFISGINNMGDGVPKPNSMGTWVAKFSDDGKLKWYKVANENATNALPSMLTATSDGGVLLSGFESGSLPDYSAEGLVLYKISKSGQLTVKTHYAKALYAADKKGEKGGDPLFTFENSEGNISVIATIAVRKQTRKDNVIYSEIIRETWLLNFTQDLDFIDAVVLDLPDISKSPNDFTSFVKFDNKYCSDGSFAVLQKDRNDNKHFTLYKFDKAGTKLWSVEKKYTAPVLYWGITHLTNGHCLIHANVGINTSAVADNYSIYNSGNLEKEFYTKYEGPLSAVICSENGYTVCFQYGLGEGKFGLKKLDNEGKELWRKTYGLKGSYANDCILTNDFGYAILAYTKDFGANYIDALIIKTDKNGDTELTPKKYIKATE